MRFLPFINGQLFLILYGIYSVVVIYVFSKIIKGRDEEKFAAGNLDEDKYYVLDNKYSLENLFYFITYKLYVKGVLIKDEADKKFYVNKESKVNLSYIEEQVCLLYLDKFSPKSFKARMVNEREFRKYYDSIYNELVVNKFIKDDQMIKNNKFTVRVMMCAIFIPGIWRLIGGVLYGMPVGALIFEIIVVFIIAISVTAIFKNKLTNKGDASKSAYEKINKSKLSNNASSKDNEIQNQGNIDEFLLGTSWMYFLGVNNTNNRNNFTGSNNDSGSSCSSCSSSSSSSCSSCSSCGGCGGGN